VEAVLLRKGFSTDRQIDRFKQVLHSSRSSTSLWQSPFASSNAYFVRLPFSRHKKAQSKYNCQTSTSLQAIRQNTSGAQEHVGSSNQLPVIDESKYILAKLARKSRTWKRLRHFLDLVHHIPQSQSHQCEQQGLCGVDIGCDHGLLSFGLAASGRFSSVAGVDVSQNALDSALDNLQQLTKHTRSDTDVVLETPAPARRSETKLLNGCGVFFKVGDGLADLDAESVDVACLAGMGVNTIMDILFVQPPQELSTSNNADMFSASSTTELQRVGCQHVLVQPTNSRPRNLIRLYDALQDAGFELVEERIELLSSRWYITALFTKLKSPAILSVKVNNDSNNSEKDATFSLPGDKLRHLSSDAAHTMHDTFSSYVEHHLNWLQKDIATKGFEALSEEDKRWLALYDASSPPS
jgi:hypothetical protein